MREKNKYGQYFTEGVVADFMVSLISHDRNASVLEPSCGKGIFLEMLDKYGFRNSLAYEIDAGLAHEFPQVKYQSFISSPIDERFDVVVGNPPYIRWKNLEQELKDELQGSVLWNRYFNSLCDYLFIFILKSIEQLNDGGELIFICSDYWMNTTHSQSLRNYMCQNGHFESIYHFKEAPLFEKVSASFVIFKYIKNKERKQNITLHSYNKKGRPDKDELMRGTCFDTKQIPQFQPNQRWLLATEFEQRQLVDFETACVRQQGLFDVQLHRLGDFCDIGNGMVSGLDAAFKVSREEQMMFNEAERQCLIHVLKAKNLEQYNYTSTETYIYMPNNISKEDFVSTYPHFVSHFKSFVDDLKKRYSYGRNIPYWEFAFPRSKNLFEKRKPKIFIPCKERISHKNYFRFCFSPEGYYPLQDVTGIILKDKCRESIEYILAYLNNERVFNWLKYNGIVKGAIVEFSEAPIASIPFLVIDWNDERQVMLHEAITSETRMYLEDKDNTHQNKINELFDTLFYEKSRLQFPSQGDERRVGRTA